jgi:hypothetical protein
MKQEQSAEEHIACIGVISPWLLLAETITKLAARLSSRPSVISSAGRRTLPRYRQPGRAKIAAAARKRWAKVRAQAKKALK